MMNRVLFSMSVIAFVLVSGCSGTPNFEVRMVDTPIVVDGATVENLFVTISDVSVHTSSSAGEQEAGWKSLGLEGVTNVDLLTLQGAVDHIIGSEKLTPGAYQQIRITVESASVVVNGVTHAVTIPSGVIKFSLQNLVIEADKKYGITIDFDAQQSLSFNNNTWSMSPSIHLAEAYLINEDNSHTPL